MRTWKQTIGVCVAALAFVSVMAVRPAMADEQDWGAVVAGEFLVLLKPDATPEAVAAAAGALAPAELLSPGSQFMRLLLDPSTTLAQLLNVPGVEAAQPNLLVEAADHLGLRHRFFTDYTSPVLTTSSTAYRLRHGSFGNAGLPGGAAGVGVVVAVLDTGIDSAHPALATRLAPGAYDFVDRDAIPAEVANGRDDNGNRLIDEAYGHGTYVAGLVALVAPRARVMPIRVLDSDGQGTSWRMMQGLARAQAFGAKVVNLSFGGDIAGPVSDEFIRRVYEAKVVMVAAAGNSASMTETYPAASVGVLGVAAISGYTGAPATFSNSGSWIDVAAPGVALTSTYPGQRYARWGGTSASAPIVAGVMAQIVSLMPGRVVDDQVDRLTSTAVIGATGGLSAYGRINAAAAVLRAREG